MDQIFIKDLRVEMSIGITSPERAKRQPVLMNITLETDLSKAAKSENIEDTVDYYQLSKDIETHALSKHFDLLETLAEDIAGICLSKEGVKRTTIKAEKPNIMSNLCHSVGVKIERP